MKLNRQSVPVTGEGSAFESHTGHDDSPRRAVAVVGGKAMDTASSITLTTLAEALQSQHLRKVDVTVPVGKLRFDNSTFNLTDAPVAITEDGVTDPNGLFIPTRVALEGIGRILGIPVSYLNHLSVAHADLFAHNVNTLAERTEGKYLLRLLKSDNPDDAYGTLRAVLSDSYRAIDNFDVLMAVLTGLKNAGAMGSRINADLTERRMIVRVQSDSVAVNAHELVSGYRSPFNGKSGKDLPLVWAGFVVSNSEVGNGAFNITPRGVFEVCENGYTHSKDAMKKIHLGTKLDDGVVQWSDTTLAANLALVTSQATDAVGTFLSPDYWQKKVAADAKEAGVPVDDAVETIDTVGRALGFSKDQRSNILNMFIKGGDTSAGGVMQAVTAAARDESDGDVALDMEANARKAMSLAAHPRTLARVAAEN